jgi:WD40 repeat protein
MTDSNTPTAASPTENTSTGIQRDVQEQQNAVQVPSDPSSPQTGQVTDEFFMPRRSNRERRRPRYYLDELAGEQALALDDIEVLMEIENTYSNNNKRASSKRKKQQQKSQKHRTSVPLVLQIPKKTCAINISRAQQLATAYPDNAWKHWPPLDLINQNHPMRLLTTKLKHSAPVFGIAISFDGSLIATSTLLGMVYLWDVSDWKLLKVLRDTKEPNIEEIYVMQFIPDNTKLFCAGVLKSRHLWDLRDEDNKVESGPIKLFDLKTGNVDYQLMGHVEEVTCIKLIKFENHPYLISCSQDGTIKKWKLKPNFSGIIAQSEIKDNTNNIVWSLEFIPDCGNKFFIAAADEGLKIYDFETEELVQEFPKLYSWSCDNVQFVYPKEIFINPNEYYLLTRGCEQTIETETGKEKGIKPNTCHLRKLVFPSATDDKFELVSIRTFEHAKYEANFPMMKIANNGRYLLAPTSRGKIFVWNINTGLLTGVLSDHASKSIVRHVVFHPFRPLLLTGGDDANVLIYAQGEIAEQDRIKEENALRAQKLKAIEMPLRKPRGRYAKQALLRQQQLLEEQRRMIMQQQQIIERLQNQQPHAADAKITEERTSVLYAREVMQSADDGSQPQGIHNSDFNETNKIASSSHVTFPNNANVNISPNDNLVTSTQSIDSNLPTSQQNTIVATKTSSEQPENSTQNTSSTTGVAPESLPSDSCQQTTGQSQTVQNIQQSQLLSDEQTDIFFKDPDVSSTTSLLDF